MSHQQEGHTETGPWFKVLSERHEKQGINFAIPGMVNQSVVHFTITTPKMKKKLPMKEYPFCYKTGFVFLPKESQKSRTIIKDRSRYWGLFRKGKTCIIAKFHRTDLVFFSHSRDGKTPSYSCINMVCTFKNEAYIILLQEYLIKSAEALAINNVPKENLLRWHRTYDPRVIREWHTCLGMGTNHRANLFISLIAILLPLK